MLVMAGLLPTFYLADNFLFDLGCVVLANMRSLVLIELRLLVINYKTRVVESQLCVWHGKIFTILVR